MLASPVTDNKRLTLAVFDNIPDAKAYLYKMEQKCKFVARKVFEVTETFKDFKKKLMRAQQLLVSKKRIALPRTPKTLPKPKDEEEE